MDLRTFSQDLDSLSRCHRRRKIIEKELNVDLSLLEVNEKTMGRSEEKNCEQMFGQVPISVGMAGPLSVTLSNNKKIKIYLPLATLEGALVASINRGCKVLTETGNAQTYSVYHGVSRSITFKVDNSNEFSTLVIEKEIEWKKYGEATSKHLKILKYDIDNCFPYFSITIYADTEDAMGMNMVTIAAQAIGNWFEKNSNAKLITIAGNIDSDKKPSRRVKEKGRGYEAKAETNIDTNIINKEFKTTPEQIYEVAKAKLVYGSNTAEALSSNLHAANIIAAIYIATGQDPAHIVEGSLADTSVYLKDGVLNVKTRLPAILMGTIGGATELPAQKQCMDLLLKECPKNMKKRQFLAEILAASVLAGEISLLAALATQSLASAHKNLGRILEHN